MSNSVVKEEKQKRLFHKDFTLVVIGQIISLFGNGILRFALPLYILQVSGSAALFGFVSAGAYLPMVIMSPIGGIVADRVNKQRIMVVLDFFTCALVGVFMILSTQVSIVPLIVITMMLLYGIQGAYSPSVQASIPLLASPENLMPANAVVNLVESLASLLGPVIGGILFGNFGLWPILVVGTISFFVSVVIELFIRIPHKKQPGAASVWQIVKGDMGVSLRFVFKEFPVMGRVMLIVFSINLFLTSMVLIGLPVIITEYLGLSSQLYGVNQAGLAVGGLLGGVLAGVVGKKLDLRNSWVLLLIVALGIIPMGIFLLLQTPALATFWLLTTCSTLMMVASTLFSIQMLSFAQGNTPTELVGKVISCILAISMCAQPVGQALYGLLFEEFGNIPGIVVLGAGIISIFISIYSKATFAKLKAR